MKEPFSKLDFRLSWLEREVETLERKIEAYDELALKLKEWTVVSWFALVSLSLTQNDYRIALLSAALPLLFMTIDASYKRIQTAFISRTRYIMRLLNSEEEQAKWMDEHGGCAFPIYDILNIYSEGKKRDPANQEWGTVWSAMRKDSVNYLYWCLVLGSAVVALCIQCWKK
jgi:hypothetical protein